MERLAVSSSEGTVSLSRRFLIRVGTAATVGAGAALLSSQRASATETTEPAPVQPEPTPTESATPAEPALDTSEFVSMNRPSNVVPVRGQGEFGVNIVDTAENGATLLHLDHSGAGSPTAYGLDIRNRVGAHAGFVAHQYSRASPFMWLDNTDSAPLIRLHNTQNKTMNPTGDGTGDFFEFQDHGVTIGKLNKDLVWITNQGNKTMTILNTVAKALSVQQASSYAGSAPAFEVIKSAPGTGAAIDVTNKGTGKALHLRQQGKANGIQVDMVAGSEGYYPLLMNGQNYGAKYTTATDGGVTLTIEKNGTGAGDAIRITNKGRGDSITFWNGGVTKIARINKDGAFVTTASRAPVESEMVDGETAIWRDPDTGDLKVTSRVAGKLRTATLVVA